MMKLIREAAGIDDTENTEGEGEVNLDAAKEMGKLKNVKKLDDSESNESNENGEGKKEEEEKDLNRQGLIRKVKNAHLIYKRENETDTYDELWVYRSGKDGIKSEIDIKNDIVSGTDIPVDGLKSDDGEQFYEIWHVGEVIFLKIFNLPN